jgi:O-acetylhomoserine/O-acetylserine sulfhydrylase
MAALEGGKHAVAVSSGAAAVLMTVLGLAKAGDNIVSSRSLYCGTFHQFEVLLPNLGIQTRFLPDNSPGTLRYLIDSRTKLVFSESIGNPQFSVPDYEILVRVAHEAGVPVVVSHMVISKTVNNPLHRSMPLSQLRGFSAGPLSMELTL